MIEIWKDVPGFKGKYQVSDLGRIKSLPRIVIQKNRLVKWPGRILKPGKTSRGYIGMKFYKTDSFQWVSVHRLVAKLFIPNPYNKRYINHLNGIKDDNRAVNLEWCTHSENVQHAYDTGLTIPCFGDNSHSSKLTSIEVRKMREDYRDKIYSQSQLAKIYNVRVSNINTILTNKTWKRVQI